MFVTNLRQIIAIILIIRCPRRRRHKNRLLAAKKFRSIWIRPSDKNIHRAFILLSYRLKTWINKRFFGEWFLFNFFYLQQFDISQVWCNCYNFVVDTVIIIFSVCLFAIVFNVWRVKKRITQIILLLRFHRDEFLLWLPL